MSDIQISEAQETFHRSIKETMSKCNRFLKRSGLPEERRQELLVLRDALKRPQLDETYRMIQSGINVLIASLEKNPKGKNVGVRVLKKQPPPPPPPESAVVADLRRQNIELEVEINRLKFELSQAPKTEDQMLNGILGTLKELAVRVLAIEQSVMPEEIEPLPPPSSNGRNFSIRFNALYNKKARELRKREEEQRKKAKAAVLEAIEQEKAREAAEQANKKLRKKAKKAAKR